MPKSDGLARSSSVNTILELRGVLSKIGLLVIEGEFPSLFPREAAHEFANALPLAAFLKRILIGDQHVGDVMRNVHVEAVWNYTKPLRTPTPLQISHFKKLINLYGPFSVLAAMQLLKVVKDAGEETTWLASLIVLGDSNGWELSGVEEIKNWWAICRRADKRALGSNNRIQMQVIHDAEKNALNILKRSNPNATLPWFGWISSRHNEELEALEWIEQPATSPNFQVSKFRIVF
jgi:hypothetical protein